MSNNVKKLISDSIRKSEKSQDVKRTSKEKQLNDYVSKVYDYLNELKSAVQRNENKLKEEIVTIKNSLLEKEKILAERQKQENEQVSTLKKELVIINSTVKDIRKEMAGNLKEIKESVQSSLNQQRDASRAGMEKISKKIGEMDNFMVLSDAKHKAAEEKEERMLAKVNDAFQKKGELLDRKVNYEQKEVDRIIAENTKTMKAFLKNETASISAKTEKALGDTRNEASVLTQQFFNEIAEVREMNDRIKKEYLTEAKFTQHISKLSGDFSLEFANIRAIQEDIKKAYATESTMNDRISQLNSSISAELDQIKQIQKETMRAYATEELVNKRLTQMGASFSDELSKIKVIQDGIQQAYATEDSMNKSLEKVSERFLKEMKMIKKIQDQIMAAYATEEAVNKNMSTIQKAFTDELTKINLVQEEIKNAYATKALLSGLDEKIRDENKARMREFRGELLSFSRMMGNVQKVQKKLTEDHNLLNKQYIDNSTMTDKSISQLNESLGNLDVKLSNSIVTELSKLKDYFINELTLEKKYMDETIETLRKLENDNRTILRKEQKEGQDSLFDKLSKTIEERRVTAAKDLKKTETAINSTIDQLKSKSAKDDSLMALGITNLLDKVNKYIEKNEAEKQILSKKISKEIEALGTSFDKNLQNNIKLTQEKASNELGQTKSSLETEMMKIRGGVDKCFFERDKLFKDTTEQIKKFLEKLNETFNEYKKYNETDKIENFKDFNKNIESITVRLGKIMKFEDSLSILNRERVQLMSILEGFYQIKKEINSMEEEKLSEFNNYVRTKAKEYREVMIQTELDAMAKAKKVSDKPLKKADEPAVQKETEKRKSSVQKAFDEMQKKFKIEDNNFQGEMEFLQEKGLSDDEIIKLYKFEFGEYRALQAMKVLNKR